MSAPGRVQSMDWCVKPVGDSSQCGRDLPCPLHPEPRPPIATVKITNSEGDYFVWHLDAEDTRLDEIARLLPPSPDEEGTDV